MNKHRSETNIIFFLFSVIVCLVILCTVFYSRDPAAQQPEQDTQQQSVSGTEILPQPDPEPAQPTPFEQALELAGQMNAHQLAGQVILVRGDHIGHDELCTLIGDISAGGVVLFKDNFADKSSDEVRAMTASLQQAGGGNLLICVDEEGGTVVRASCFSALRDRKFRSPQKIYADGGFDSIAADTREKCEFLLGLGVNVNFAPVADVVTDPSGFLYSRAFGMDAQATAQYVETVVSAMSEYPIGSSLKHFPGYGNASGDTHGELVVSAVTQDTLYTDLLPFEAGIAAGADSVMLTHTIIDSLDPQRPASLSPAAVGLLRGELDFDGVLITDGLDMDAISIYCGESDPGVTALCAGLDLLCTPSDARATHAALLSALESGQLSHERLLDAAAHVIEWKLELGLVV